MKRHNTISHNPPPLLSSLRRRSIGRIAMLYYPDIGYKAALRLFRKELKSTRGLLTALKAQGYNEHQRILTRTQIQTIEDFLGEA